MHPITRREFLAGLGGIPFFRFRRFRTLAGVRFEVVRRGRSGRRYLRIHGNETTAAEVLRRFLKTNPGTGYIAAGQERNVRIDGALLDPNRLFSREGAERNLRMLNPELPEARVQSVLAALDRDRETLVRALVPPGGELLVALHNNGEGYSVHDEVPVSDRVALNGPEHPHDFFLCTAEADFRAISRLRYNVVLQNRAPKEDDGSLSRLAARRNLRYVNIEAALGNFEKQMEMLACLR